MTHDPLAHATWRTSSRSATKGDCVGVAQISTVTGIRDSKNPTGRRLVLTPLPWTSFLNGVTNGDPGLLP